MDTAQCPFCKGTGFRTTSEIPPAFRRNMHPLTEPCRNCLGNARLPGGIPCPVCHDTGQRFVEMNGELTYPCNACEGKGEVQVYTTRQGILHSFVFITRPTEKWSAISDSPECKRFVDGLLQEKAFDNAEEQIVELMRQHGFITDCPSDLSTNKPECLFSHVMTARVYYEAHGTAECRS